MTTEQDLKPLIESALQQSWSEFAERHPRLAGVLDARAVQLSATQSLAADPAYRKAIDDAITAQATLETISDIIATRVRKWFERLV
jgi:hypothetical protein